MYRFVLFVTLLPAFALATEGWRPCTGGRPAPLYVNVTGCDAPPCDLPRGSDIYYQSMFIATEYAEELSTYAHFKEIESGIEGNFPLPPAQKNTCGRLVRASCPVYPDEEIIYELTMAVLRIYPTGMELDLEMSVVNGNGETQSCFQLLCTTTN